MGEGVEEYFESRSSRYQQDSERLPWSWLRGRERRAVLELAGSLQNQTVIDWGSGAGYYARQFRAGGARCVFAVDQSRGMLEAIPESIERVCGRAEDVHLPEAGDVAVCAGLLEFVDNPSELFRQFDRYAKFSARLVVLVPFRNLAGYFYRRYHRSHGIRVRLFNESELRTLGERAGFRFVRTILIRPFSLSMLFEKEVCP